MKGIELYAPREPRHRRTWTWAAVVLALVFIIGGQALSVLPGVAGFGYNLVDELSPWPELGYVLAVSFGLTALMVFAWVWLFERRRLDAIGFNARGGPRFLRGYLLGLGLLGLVVGVIAALGGYPIDGVGVFQSAAVLPGMAAIVILLIGFIIQGSTEEIVMRGWLMQLVASRHGLWIAVFVNSVVFSLLHAGNIEPSRELAIGLVNIVLVGVFLSLYAAREGSLWGVCGWHAAWNWLLGLGFGLEVSGQVIDTPPLFVDMAFNPQTAWWITGGDFGPEASVVTTVVLVAGTIWVLLRKTHDFGVAASKVEAAPV